MKEYVTVADVDAALGSDWAAPEKKSRAVMIANIWLTNQGLPDLDPMPAEWVQAGAEIAKDAAAGKLYGAKETGVLSKSVSAGDVSSSKSFSSTARTYTAGESLALALLKPWLNGMSGVMFLKRV
ncbi:MAG: hypothetical protein KER_03082 [Kerstersia gyiorum]|uniref:hypothetical protein n=1 Tax=Kerstersia gyiorum TaxID=206506 RepID=UPI0030CE438A